MTIERATGVTELDEIVYDDRGNPTRTWAAHLEVQGSNQPLRVEEVAQLSQAGPVASTHRVFILGTPDIHEYDRIVDGGVTYQIDGIADPAGARHHMEILVHAVTDPTLEAAA